MFKRGIDISKAAAHKLIGRFLGGISRSMAVLGIFFIFMALVLIWATVIRGFFYMHFLFLIIFIIGFDFFIIRHQLREIPPNNQEEVIDKTFTEFKLILIFILLINLSILFLSILPFFVIQFNVINFTRPFSVVLTWFCFSQGFFLCVLSYFFYSRKLKILSQVRTRPILHKFFEPTEGQRAELTYELKDRGIISEGAILMVFEKVGYSNRTYVLKRFRKWPWQERGRIILTEKDLIFLGKKAKIVIPLSDIRSIQPVVGRGGIRTYKVCEIIYAFSKKSVVFYGNVSFWASDIPTELELKSMQLMESIQKWYNIWKQE